MRKKISKKAIYLLLAFWCMWGLCACGSSSDQSATDKTFTRRSASTPAESQSNQETSMNKLYMIVSFDSQEEHITLENLKNGRQYRYRYSLTTEFLDKYGDTSSSNNFTPGRVVTLGKRLSDNVLSSIKISDAVWEADDIKNFTMDKEDNIFTIGETNYRIASNASVFSNNLEAQLSDISNTDVLRVVGMDKTIYSFTITTGHGYLTLLNTDIFEGSLISVGDILFTKVTKDMTIEVPEGTYNVTVANNGYGGTKSVTIVRNEMATLDLNELKGEGPKSCKVRFNVSVEGAKLYLDGTAIDASKEIDVQYGAHSLLIQADGYDDWEKTLYVNSPTAVITLDLSDEDDSSNSTSTSGTTSSGTTSSGTTNSGTTNSGTTSSGTTSSGTTNSGKTSSGTTSSGTTSSGTTNSGTTSSNTKKSTSSNSADTDYLTTLSNMISTLSGTDD